MPVAFIGTVFLIVVIVIVRVAIGWFSLTLRGRRASKPPNGKQPDRCGFTSDTSQTLAQDLEPES